MLGAGRPRNRVSIPGTGALSKELKWPGNEPDYSPLSSSAIKNVWSYSSTEPYTFIFCTVKILYIYIYIYIYTHTHTQKWKWNIVLQSGRRHPSLCSNWCRPLHGPSGRDSRDSCDWQVLQGGRCHMALPSTAALSSFVDSKIGIHFKTNVLYNNVPHMLWCTCHHFDSGQAHINNAYVVESH